jgi:uncharacterized small protein (DUF1192 family)
MSSMRDLNRVAALEARCAKLEEEVETLKALVRQLTERQPAKKAA